MQKTLAKVPEPARGSLLRSPKGAEPDARLHESEADPQRERAGAIQSLRVHGPPADGHGSQNTPADLLQAHPALRLQRSIGNYAVQRSLGTAEQEKTEASLQRSCTACADEDTLQRSPASANVEGGLLTDVRAFLLPRPANAVQRDAVGGLLQATRPDKVIPAHSRGEPLDDTTRREMESGLHQDLRGVRVHTDAPAGEAARALNANAFTARQEIYFAPGKYNPAANDGKRLLAHELAHTVQQREGRTPARVVRTVANKVAGIAIGHPEDALEHEADRAADRVLAAPPVLAPPLPAAPEAAVEAARPPAGGAPPAGPPPPAPGATIQRDEAQRGEADEPGLLQKTASALVAEVSPELANLIREGPFHYFKRHVEALIKEGLPALLSAVDLTGPVAGLRAWFSKTFDSIRGAFSGDSKSCKAFTEMLGEVREVAEDFLDSPELKQLKSGLEAVDDAYTSFLKVVLAPQFEALKTVLGGAWTGIQKVADTVAGWVRKVREKAGAAWDWVAEKLGLTGGDETGVWAWVKRQASAAWTEIKATLAPIAAPLSKVAKSLLLLTPMGPVWLIVEEGPKVVATVKWLWEHRDDPNIAENARAMKDTYLPQLVGGVASFNKALDTGLSWLAETVGTVAESVLGFLGELTHLPLLSLVRSGFQAVQTRLDELSTWARQVFAKGVAAARELGKAIADYVAPWKEVLSSIVVAILNPPMIPLILAGWAWRKLHRCIKEPLLKFLLEIITKALQAAPTLAIFGVIWPLLKAGVVGFLKRMAKAPYAEQEAVSDKFAKIISGASPDFLIGFATGFLEGVWDGIADPFRAILAVLDGLHYVQTFFENLASDALGLPRAGGVALAEVPPAQGANAAPMGAGSSGSPGAAGSSAAPIGGIVPTQAPPAATSAGGASALPAAPVAATQAGGTNTLSANSMGANTQSGNTAVAAAELGATPDTGDSDTARAGVPQALDTADKKELGQAAQQFATEAGPDILLITTNFLDASKEYFSSSGGTSFETLTAKLGEAWRGMLGAMEGKGGELAEAFIKWFTTDAAEGVVGNKLGWLGGTIVFQLLLDFITAGGWVAAGPTVMAIARFINWPMEVLGQALKVLGKLARYLVDGAKSLARLVKQAAAGALKVVGEAIGRLGGKLLAFAERLFGRFGRLFEKEGASLGKQGLGELGARETGKVAGREGESLLEHELQPLTDSKATRDAAVDASKNVENKALTPHDAEAQLEYLADNPHLLEGAAPARRAKIGEHEWFEQPNGNWCRHSDGELCTKLPRKLREALAELPKVDPKAPIREGEVAPYAETTTKGRGVSGDTLTGDHIPSRAALVQNIQDRIYAEQAAKLKRALSPAELKKFKLTEAEIARINNEGLTIVDQAKFHEKYSPTFGGRNTAAQIATDAKDLGVASLRDFGVKLTSHYAEGTLTRQTVIAYIDLYERSVSRGIYPYSKDLNELLSKFLRMAK